MSELAGREALSVLDVSIVGALNQGVLNLPNPTALFQSSDFEDLFRPSVSYSQSVMLDPSRGAAATHEYESMASQKSVSIGPLRLEVHDRSGRYDGTSSDLPDLFHRLALHLDIHDLQAIGFNYQVQVRSAANAARTIATRLLADFSDIIPAGSQVRGGAARLYFAEGDDSLYSLYVEPRFNDLATTVIWMSLNYNVNTSALLDRDELGINLSRGYAVIQRLANEFASQA